MGSPLVELPLLPLRDVVVYPHMVLPLFVGREKSIQALEDAMAGDKQVLLVAQRDAADDNPGAEQLYRVGTVSNILQLLKLPDGTIKVLVEGTYRAGIQSVEESGPFAVATVEEVDSEEIPEPEADALVRSTVTQFEKYVNLSKKVPAEVLTSLSGIDEPGRLARGGNVRYQLKTPYRDGTTHVIFEPLDFIARLAALVPKPRVNLTRFHGVFAPNSRHRALVTPAKRGRGNKVRVADEPATPAQRRASMTWAQRLKRVFNIDIETCSGCGGAMKVIACIEDPIVIKQILDHLKHKAETSGTRALPESRAPPAELLLGLFD